MYNNIHNTALPIQAVYKMRIQNNSKQPAGVGFFNTPQHLIYNCMTKYIKNYFVFRISTREHNVHSIVSNIIQPITCNDVLIVTLSLI